MTSSSISSTRSSSRSVVVLDEVLFENVLVEVFFVERGLVLEVVVSSFGVPSCGGRKR